MRECQKTLVTGANGFIGTAVCRRLLEDGHAVRMTGQARVEALEALGADYCAMADLSGEVDWSPALEGVDAVVHLAGVAHRLGEDQWASQDLYERVNHLATTALAEAIAARPGIRQFLFASTVAVHGNPASFPIRADSQAAPLNPYGASKLSAEKDISRILGGGPTAWAILRPVVVYGPGNPGNMGKLQGLIQRGIPVPVPSEPNRRSFLYVGNLVDALATFLGRGIPPGGHTWIIADPEPVSTEFLVRSMAAAMGLRPRILRLPRATLGGLARIGDALAGLGLPAPWNSEIQGKVAGDHFVDLAATRDLSGWTPPYDTAEGVRRTFSGDPTGRPAGGH